MDELHNVIEHDSKVLKYFLDRLPILFSGTFIANHTLNARYKKVKTAKKIKYCYSKEVLIAVVVSVTSLMHIVLFLDAILNSILQDPEDQTDLNFSSSKVVLVTITSP